MNLSSRLLRTVATLICLLPVMATAAPLSLFACEPEWAALARELAGPNARIHSATHARQDPHHIQARPSLIARLRSADLLVCTGAGLEAGWLPLLQRRARNPAVLPGQPGHFEAASQVKRLEIPERVDRSLGDVHAEGNPHIHLDPRRLRRVAAALAERLARLDPDHAEDYRRRLADFDSRWQAAIARWEAAARPLQGKRVVVHHPQWIYLLDWLGMQRAAALEPRPGIPPTAGHLARLQQVDADLIIRSPLDDPRPAAWLHERTGMPVVVLPHTVGAVAASDDLFAFFDVLIQRLVEASPQ